MTWDARGGGFPMGMPQGAPAGGIGGGQFGSFRGGRHPGMGGGFGPDMPPMRGGGGFGMRQPGFIPGGPDDPAMGGSGYWGGGGVVWVRGLVFPHTLKVVAQLVDGVVIEVVDLATQCPDRYLRGEEIEECQPDLLSQDHFQWRGIDNGLGIRWP